MHWPEKGEFDTLLRHNNIVKRRGEIRNVLNSSGRINTNADNSFRLTLARLLNPSDRSIHGWFSKCKDERTRHSCAVTFREWRSPGEITRSFLIAIELRLRETNTEEIRDARMAVAPISNVVPAIWKSTTHLTVGVFTFHVRPRVTARGGTHYRTRCLATPVEIASQRTTCLPADRNVARSLRQPVARIAVDFKSADFSTVKIRSYV